MSIFPHRRLGDLIEEVSERNRTLQCTDVYSVTNSQGFVPSEDYFNKKVFSKDLSNYKLVRHEMFAYNPSRINIGSIAWLRDMPCVAVSPLYVIFRIKEADVLPSWIEYFLRSDIGCAQIRGLTSGSVRDSLKYSALERIEIPIAPVEEQQRILANLATLDKSIKLCGILLEKMDELVKSQFVEMFGDPVANPKGWEVKKLKEICAVGSSKRIYQREQTSTGVPFLRISDLVTRITSQEETSDLYISNETFNKFEQQGLVPKTGDILVTARGTLGLCYIIKPEDRFYFQDGMISWVHTSEANVNSVYISYLFDSQGIKKQIDRMVTGSTVDYLSIAQLGQFDILLPPLALQNEFVAFVEQVDKSKLVLRQLLEKQKTLKAALMQEYFS